MFWCNLAAYFQRYIDSLMTISKFLFIIFLTTNPGTVFAGGLTTEITLINDLKNKAQRMRILEGLFRKLAQFKAKGQKVSVAKIFALISKYYPSVSDIPAIVNNQGQGLLTVLLTFILDNPTPNRERLIQWVIELVLNGYTDFVNTPDDSGRTALDYAIELGHEGLLTALVDAQQLTNEETQESSSTTQASSTAQTSYNYLGVVFYPFQYLYNLISYSSPVASPVNTNNVSHPAQLPISYLDAHW